MRHTVLAAVLLCCACEAEPRTGDDTTAAAPIPQRPERTTDTISIEGMREPVELTLFETGDEFPVPFSTYLAPGFTADARDDADTASVRFTARFTPESDPNVYMHVVVYPPGAPIGDVETQTLRFIDSRDVLQKEFSEAAPPPWARRAYTFRYGRGNNRYVGSVAVGERDGRAFVVMTHYPPEYGDGFGPRADLIFRHWRWETTGEPLRTDRQP